MRRPITIALSLACATALLSADALANAPAEAPALSPTAVVAPADTVLAMNHPPRRHYYPRRPYRRVYRAPATVRQPRRPVAQVRFPTFHIGLGVHGNSVLDDDGAIVDDGLETGGGFELSLGFRVAPTVSIDLGWTASFHDAGNHSLSEDAMLSAFTVDGRFFLTDRTRRLQPYLQAGLGAYILSRDRFDYDTLAGVGFQLGGGLDLYLTRAISIGARLLYRGAYVDNESSGDPFLPPESAFLSMFTYGADVKFHF